MPDARDLVIDAKTPARCLPRSARGADRGGAPARRCASTRSRWRRACASWPPRTTGRSSSAARSSPSCSCPATSSCRRRSPSGRSCSRTALAQSVIIATPSTLVALLKTVAYGWRQSAVAHNAAQIRDLGQELYRRLGSFHAHLGRMGQRLGAAVEAYNARRRLARAPGAAPGAPLQRSRRDRRRPARPARTGQAPGAQQRHPERGRTLSAAPAASRRRRAPPCPQRLTAARARARPALLSRPRSARLSRRCSASRREIRARLERRRWSTKSPTPASPGGARNARGSRAGNALHPLTRTARRTLFRGERAPPCPPCAASSTSPTWDLAARHLRNAPRAGRLQRALECSPRGAARAARAARSARTRAALALGSRLHELELLNALGADARAGRLRLPLAELAQAQASPEELAAQPSWRAALAALVRSAARRRPGRRWHTRSPRSPPSEQPALRALLVWAATRASRTRSARLAALPHARVPGRPSLPRWMAGAPGAPRGAPRAGRLRLPAGDFEERPHLNRRLRSAHPRGPAAAELAGRVIAITGASGGIGRAIALGLRAAPGPGDPHRPQRRQARGGARRDPRHGRAGGLRSRCSISRQPLARDFDQVADAVLERYGRPGWAAAQRRPAGHARPDRALRRADLVPRDARERDGRLRAHPGADPGAEEIRGRLRGVHQQHRRAPGARLLGRVRGVEVRRSRA